MSLQQLLLLTGEKSLILVLNLEQIGSILNGLSHTFKDQCLPRTEDVQHWGRKEPWHCLVPDYHQE